MQYAATVPNVVDRMVQQAVHQVIEPIFEPIFHDSSHGFRRDRGAQTAIALATRYFEEGCAYTVDIDLSKFFDRVHHQRLLGRMSEHLGDGRVLKLIHRMLKANVVLPEGTRVSTEEGTPQGGPLSPLLSNIVLNELDWELERRGLRFVRYADDFSTRAHATFLGELFGPLFCEGEFVPERLDGLLSALHGHTFFLPFRRSHPSSVASDPDSSKKASASPVSALVTSRRLCWDGSQGSLRDSRTLETKCEFRSA